jgi:hypothetical protein
MSDKIQRIEIPMHIDARGRLLAIEENVGNLPFTPRRTFYLFDVPATQKRAGHAVDCDLFVIAIKGEVTLINIGKGDAINRWTLSQSNVGVFVPAFHYIELTDFSSDAVVAVFASKKFKDTQYYSLNEIQERK